MEMSNNAPINQCSKTSLEHFIHYAKCVYTYQEHTLPNLNFDENNIKHIQRKVEYTMQITRIQGFERYLITEDGTIYDTLKNRVVNATWHIRDKEFRVKLYDENNKAYTRCVHRLIIKSFKKLDEKEYVLFEDGDKRHLNICNLVNTRSNRQTSLEANREPIYTISAYQELRDVINEIGLSDENINDKELEEVMNELLSHQQTKNLIKEIINSKVGAVNE